MSRLTSWAACLNVQPLPRTPHTSLPTHQCNFLSWRRLANDWAQKPKTFQFQCKIVDWALAERMHVCVCVYVRCCVLMPVCVCVWVWVGVLQYVELYLRHSVRKSFVALALNITTPSSYSGAAASRHTHTDTHTITCCPTLACATHTHTRTHRGATFCINTATHTTYSSMGQRGL